jgi:hypothetical protein
MGKKVKDGNPGFTTFYGVDERGYTSCPSLEQ